MNTMNSVNHILKAHIFLILILFINSSLSAYFISRVTLKPNITFFGVGHFIGGFDTDKEHLKIFLTKLANKTTPCFVLVEDPFQALNRPLKNLNPDYIKHRLLSGLVERINAIANPNIHAFSIERRLILYKALDFFNSFLIPPFFGDHCPEKIKLKQYLNPYDLSFDDLIKEITQCREALNARCAFYKEIPNASIFINVKIKEIDESIQKLIAILQDNKIPLQASMLHAAIDLFLKDRIYKLPDQLQAIAKLSANLNRFMYDYVNMDKTSWKQQKQILTKSILNILSEPSMPLHTQQQVPEQENVHDKLYQRLLKLGLLIVDSHATLDVIQYANQGIVIIVAGDLHVQNMKQYLTHLGHEEIPTLTRNNNDFALDPSDIDL